MPEIKNQLIIPASADVVWDFLVQPANLIRISPPQPALRNLDPVPERIFRGAQIKHELLFFGLLRITWQSAITDYKESEYFIDEQQGGSFKNWRHRHGVVSISRDKCIITDEIHFELKKWQDMPGVRKIVVLPILQNMFDFRNKKMQEFFQGHNIL